MKKILTSVNILIITLVLLAALIGIQPANAAVGIVVNTAADNTTDDGLCSLREAIINANADAQTHANCDAGSGADIITFAGDYTITLGSALPTISTTLTIDGSGQSVTVDGANTYRVFEVTSIGNFTINQITVQNGSAPPDGGGDSYGGGVFNAGSLTVSNSTLANNSADDGGGIFTAGVLMVSSSIFSGNMATTYAGGGITVYQTTAVISNSTFSGNSAASSGGGIFESSSMLTVTNSTFSGNSAVFDGGGISHTAGGGGTVTVMNSTFSGNNAGNGGGIFIDSSGVLDVTHSIISGNSASLDGGGIFNEGTITSLANSTFSGNSTGGGDGGGLYNNGTITSIANSTFSENTADRGEGLFNTGTGTITSIANTIIAGNGIGNCVLVPTGTNNLTDSSGCGSWTNTLVPAEDLAPLADNGGSTQTYALLGNADTNPAIDGGDAATCAATPVNNLDQRGATRPFGSQCDIGAYESGSRFIVNTAADTSDGSCDALGTGSGNMDCTLREAINAANADADASIITFADDYTLTLGSSLPQITTEITLEGAGNTIDGGWDGVVGSGTGVRIFYVASTGNFTINQATVQNGKAIDGGGIYNNNGTLTVSNSTISGNSAPNYGGGIYNNNGTLTVSNSTFSGNTATFGGGINSQSGIVTVTNSTFSANSASDRGGGIRNYGTVTISNSTFSGNSADLGGGILNHGTVTVSNSTFSGNTANDVGGIYNPSSGILMVSNSTFSGNAANNVGGVYNSGTAHLAGNVFAAGQNGDNCTNSGTLNDNGYNLSDDATCTNGGIDSMINATLNLSDLADNGGPTQTHLPSAGSEAIGAIPNGTTINNNGVSWTCDQGATDQRGESRPINSGDACTAGAVEVEPPSLCPSWTVTTADELSDCITLANSNETPSPTADTITLGADITLTTALPQITSEITLEGAGYAVDGGDSVQLFYVASTGNFTINQATLQNGFATNDGGAIHNHAGTVTVTDSTFTSNDASGFPWDGGGAIYNFTDGTLTVSNSTFINNSAPSGGAILTDAYRITLTVSNSTFTNNSAQSGGAIAQSADDGISVTTISNNTFDTNSASYGGALHMSAGIVRIANNTFSYNTATNDGGGIYTIHSGHSATSWLAATNNTFSGNSAPDGGAIYNIARFYLAGNIFDAGATGDNCVNHYTLTDNGYNLSDDATCTNGGTGSATNATLNLGALADNGGPTQTHLPSKGSAAIGAIPNGTTINNNGVTLACNQTSTDQRGESRPLNSGGDCTAGAVEVSSTTSVLYLSSEDTASINGLAYADEDIIAYDPAAGSWAMHFDGSDVTITDDIYGFALLEDGSILMAFKNPISVPGVGSVTRSDVVQFFPASLGETTSGTFALVFDGSDVGLTAAIDAVGVTADGRLILSTTGSWSVPATGGGSISGADEDLIVFNATSLGATTAGDFELLYDGSDVDMSSENTNGVWLDTTTGDLYLTTTGDFSVTGLSGKDEDIFRFVPTSLGSNTAGSYDPDLFFDGSTVGYTRRVTGFAINADQPLLAITPPPAGDEADLSIILVEDNDPVTVGDAIRYSATVHNNGPDAAQNVQVVISLDSKVLLQSVSSSVGTCSGTTTVTCSLGTLVNGAGATITLDTKAIAAGTAVHTATVSSDTTDLVVGNNSEGEDTLINSGDSSPTGNIIYISTTGSGNIGGVRYEDEDILAYYPDSDTWAMFFDGSLQGFTRDINAFHISDNGSIYMSFDGEVTIPDVGAVTRQDIVFYDATTGIFSLFFDGSAHDLTSSDENIDALYVDSSGNLLISTTGTAKVNGSSLEVRDEDVMRFNVSTQTWELWIDSSDTGYSDDINALWLSGNDAYLSLNGSFSAVGAERRDVFIMHVTQFGDTTAGTYGPGLFFDASAVGFSGDIDGLHVSMNP